MLGKILHFIKYHNAVSLGAALLLLSTGGALAASPDLREGVAGALLSVEQSVKTVDNTYIRDIDLNSFAPRVQVASVTEDDDSYYVEYNFETVGLADGAWKPVMADRTLTVSKGVLGERDLGLHVTSELKQLVDRELARLKETQAIERKSGEQQKVVATAYSGLIGKFLDPKEESFDGYAPVKLPPPPPIVATEEPASSALKDEKPVTTADGSDTNPPTFQILGNNPAMVPVRSNWRDLGAFVTDDTNPNIGYEVIGLETVDLTTVGEYTITYRAVDQAGNVGTAERTVIVFDPNAPEGEQSTDTTATTSDSGVTVPVVPQTDEIGAGTASGTTTATSTAETN